MWPVLLVFVLQKATFLASLAARSDEPLLSALFIGDGPHYLRLAEAGYDPLRLDAQGRPLPSLLAFFPLYPMAARALAWLPFVTPRAALVILAALGSVAAAWGLVALGTALATRTTGVALALIWGLVPRSFVQVLPYSEGLFTALSVWALVALTHRRWWWAAALCALAGLTRPTGAATLAAVGGTFLVLLVQRWRGRSSGPSTGTIIGAGLLSASGLALALAHVAWRTRSLDGYSAVQAEWNLRMGPVSTTWQLWWQAISVNQPPGRETVTGVALALPVWTILLVVLLVMAARRTSWRAVAVQALVMWLMMAATQTYFHSRERYLLPAVGLVLPVAADISAWWRARPGWLTRLVLGGLWVVATLASAWWGAFLVSSSQLSP